MGHRSAPWSIIFLTLVITIVKAEDSLRSALNAVTRRQRGLSDLSRYGDNFNDAHISGYGYDEADDLSFLNPNNDFAPDPRHNLDLERTLLNYIEQNGLGDSGREELNKRISSSFRERVEEDKEQQRKKIAEILFQKLEGERESQDNEEYEEFLRQLWNKHGKVYANSYDDMPRGYAGDEVKKRSYPDYYPSLGWESVGMRKRNRYYEPDGAGESLYLLNYPPRDEIYNMLQEEEDTPEVDLEFYNPSKYAHRDRKFESHQRFPKSGRKRFPVTKRSSNYFSTSPNRQRDFMYEEKRSTKKEMALKTDPKVAEELSNIFGASKQNLPEKPKKLIKKIENSTAKPEKKTNTTSELKNKSDKTKESKHEIMEVAGSASKDTPLQIKKKSINWSDYFGLDKRKKKSDDGDLDNEWLMERYHKAIAMATKRNAEYPLRNFHNHEMKKETFEDKKEPKSEEAKIGEMDSKLKTIEDSIVDEALKFTGAHEGTADSKEIQEVKDKVISRLAAAYSLEKMRRALGEYRMSVAKERSRMKEDNGEDYMLEEKRVSVPRKQAIDEDREKTPESDNNIKCTQGDEECDEQNYKIPSDFMDRSEWDKAECPKVQRACNEVASVLGHYGRIFETACNVHQICLLCGENSWFAPTRRCNVLFLSKADELCDGDLECQGVARRSVRYLLDINRSLRVEPLGECDLACPESR